MIPGVLYSNQSFKGNKKPLETVSKVIIRKLIKQEPVPPHVPMTRRTKYFLDKWVKITNSQKTLNIVQGYKPRFLVEPFQSFQPKTIVQNQQEAKIIQEEINTLSEKEAIKPYKSSKVCSKFLPGEEEIGWVQTRDKSQELKSVHSRIALYDGDYYKNNVIKRRLNHDNRYFRCISHYSSGRGIQGLCSFPVSGSDLSISVYAFQPKRCHKGLHKDHEALCD